MSNILLKNVTIVAADSPLNGRQKDILINAQGIIENIGDDLPFNSKKDKLFDKPGTCVSIGWMDIGAHFGDPGFEYREDLESLNEAAMAGGFTKIAPFPNTSPVIQSRADIYYVQNKTRDLLVDVLPIGALSVGCKGKDLAELVDMYTSGAVAFSDGNYSVQDAGLMMRGLQYAKIFDGLIINTPADTSIAPGGQIHEGLISVQLGLTGIPAIAETLMIERDLTLLAYADSRLHIYALTTSEAVDAIRLAKKSGLNISASVTALHLAFTDDALADFDTQYKVFPPLRDAGHITALKKGLIDGTIDFITSQHTPIDADCKHLEFPEAEFGIINLETAISLSYEHLKDILSLEKFIDLWTIQPRKTLRTLIPKIAIGEKADLTLFNPNVDWKYETKNIRSKSKNSPLIGKNLPLKIEGVINKGKSHFNE